MRRNNQLRSRSRMFSQKYANCEYMHVQGGKVRRLSAREIAEFKAAIAAGPIQPIRLCDA